MNDLNILVVEDREDWQDTLELTLKKLGRSVIVDLAPTYSKALEKIRDKSYSLAIVDLGLPDDVANQHEEYLGLALLGEIRRSDRNGDCGLIVLTVTERHDVTRRALREYKVYDCVIKDDFKSETFLQTASESIFQARLTCAKKRSEFYHRVTIAFNDKYLLGSELSGPSRQLVKTPDNPPPFDIDDLSRRADNLNLFLMAGGPKTWRPEAKSIGKEIYQALDNRHSLLEPLIAARALAPNNVWLQFIGPSLGLSVPFELARDEEDYLCLKYPLTRRIRPSVVSLKVSPFHAFLENLSQANVQDRRLTALVVGSNSDGNIPEAEVEAEVVARMIEEEARILGFQCSPKMLLGDDATFARVCDELKSGRYHLFHYAGHGRYNDKLPEISGLILKDHESKSRTLDAASLFLLVKNSQLQLVFLSCCLGARTGLQIGSGDFHGTLEAIARADIPNVIGYRWIVSDDSAQTMAKAFYQNLWRTLSPAEAMREARESFAIGWGRNDETWASPVQLMQNG
jgi:CheY-like chemotaxis protein